MLYGQLRDSACDSFEQRQDRKEVAKQR